MKCSDNAGKVLGALLVGAAVGGALGILFAPDKGTETRRKIVDTTGEITDSVKEKLNDLLEEIKDEVAAVSKKANGLLGRS